MEKEKNSKITREEALRRLETARKLKREYVAKLEKEMKEEFIRSRLRLTILQNK